jgi:hypothetical protein
MAAASIMQETISDCKPSRAHTSSHAMRLSSAVPPKFLLLYLTHVPRQRSLSPYISTYNGSPYINPLYPTTTILYTLIIN